MSLLFNEQLSELGAGRPDPSIDSCSLNKSNIPDGCHAEFWSFHDFQVSSNPHLTLVEESGQNQNVDQNWSMPKYLPKIENWWLVGPQKFIRFIAISLILYSTNTSN